MTVGGVDLVDGTVCCLCGPNVVLMVSLVVIGRVKYR
jgi:hypothetical protein